MYQLTRLTNTSISYSPCPPYTCTKYPPPLHVYQRPCLPSRCTNKSLSHLYAYQLAPASPTRVLTNPCFPCYRPLLQYQTLLFFHFFPTFPSLRVPTRPCLPYTRTNLPPFLPYIAIMTPVDRDNNLQDELTLVCHTVFNIRVARIQPRPILGLRAPIGCV